MSTSSSTGHSDSSWLTTSGIRPGDAPVVAYVTEEVIRQGHDVRASEGITRVGWMLNAWSEALIRSKAEKPDLVITERLGVLVEPGMNARGFRTCDVHVGGIPCPSPERLHAMLLNLFEQRDSLQPLEFYKAFEQIHPFADGNGRTGKILLNWLTGTLLAPIFPPSDLWGAPILNP